MLSRKKIIEELYPMLLSTCKRRNINKTHVNAMLDGYMNIIAREIGKHGKYSERFGKFKIQASSGKIEFTPSPFFLKLMNK